MRVLFWTAWVIAAVVTAILVCFFFAGLADGTVSSFNLVLWTGILACAVAVTFGSLWLKRANHPVLATVVAMLLGLPGLLAGVFLLILLTSHPRWN